MTKTIISEGKTSTEAIEKGLKKLNVTKNMVEIKILETEKKKSFFSILDPRVVKVELTLKENFEDTEKHFKNNEKIEKEHIKRNTEKRKLSREEIDLAKSNITKFLTKFSQDLEENQIIFDIGEEESHITVKLEGKNISFLIGYRGEVLNAFQSILSGIANQNIESKVNVILDIEGYRKKRKITLERLAEKLAKTVIKTGKSITLEPMSAYERKIIHTHLQENHKVKTYSIGEEPNRKVIIELKK